MREKTGVRRRSGDAASRQKAFCFLAAGGCAGVYAEECVEAEWAAIRARLLHTCFAGQKRSLGLTSFEPVLNKFSKGRTRLDSSRNAPRVEEYQCSAGTLRDIGAP